MQSKPELAAQMLLSIHAEGVLPLRYIGAESVYGNGPVLLEKELGVTCTGGRGTSLAASLPDRASIPEWLGHGFPRQRGC